MELILSRMKINEKTIKIMKTLEDSGISEYLNYSMNYSDDINTILLTTPKCSYFLLCRGEFSTQEHQNIRKALTHFIFGVEEKGMNKEKIRKFIFDGHTLLNIISHNIIDNKNDVFELRV